MSLINCPECKREISDKAETCPHCGFKIASQGDIVFLCPRCLGCRMDPVDRKYRAGIGALGYALVGPIGALAGVSGLNKVEFTCKECREVSKANHCIPVKVRDVEVVKDDLMRIIKDGDKDDVRNYMCEYINRNNINIYGDVTSKFAEFNEVYHPMTNLQKIEMIAFLSILMDVLFNIVMAISGFMNVSLWTIILPFLVAFVIIYFSSVNHRSTKD